MRRRAFRTGSALPLLEDRVPVLGAFGPEAPDPYVALREGVRGPVAGVVGIEAAVNSREAEGLQPLQDGGADARPAFLSSGLPAILAMPRGYPSDSDDSGSGRDEHDVARETREDECTEPLRSAWSRG